jgi:DNA polymerase epsilon subunit 3
VAQSKQHKSISASDVLKALEMLEFGDLVDPFQAELSSEICILTLYILILTTMPLVYRDQSKKKSGGSASVSTSKGAKASTSKSKGKEKVSTSTQGPFTSAPLAAPVGGSISTGPMVVDNEDVDGDAERQPDEEDAEMDGGDDHVAEDDEEMTGVDGQSKQTALDQVASSQNGDDTRVSANV